MTQYQIAGPAIKRYDAISLDLHQPYCLRTIKLHDRFVIVKILMRKGGNTGGHREINGFTKATGTKIVVSGHGVIEYLYPNRQDISGQK